MDIHTLSALTGLNDTDLSRASVAVIDVFRASSTILCLMENGAVKVAVTDSVAVARKRQKEGWIAIGERGGRRVAGFDLDNSPYQVSQRSWDSQDVVVTTSNGTRALVAVRDSAEVILAGVRNLDAAADCLRASTQDRIVLIPIGSNHQPRAEDELCAQALEARLRNEPVDLESLIARVRLERAEDIAGRGERYRRDVDLALQPSVTRIIPVLEDGLTLRRTFA